MIIFTNIILLYLTAKIPFWRSYQKIKKAVEFVILDRPSLRAKTRGISSFELEIRKRTKSQLKEQGVANFEQEMKKMIRDRLEKKKTKTKH